jgi:HEAT repeat protein
MSTRRAIMWMGIVLIAVAAAAVLHPDSPVYLTTLLGKSGEHDGHSTRYWMQEMKSQNDEARWHAIFSLGAIGKDAGEAVPALAKTLREHPDARTRNEAALALSKMDPASKSAVPALAEALSDSEYIVRWNAATALFRLRADARPAIPALIKALQDDTNKTNLGVFMATIQDMAALALGGASAGTPDGVAVLTETLANVTKTESRISTARALGYVGPEAKSAVPQLRLLLKDEDRWVRLAAEEALQKIEGTPAAAATAPPGNAAPPVRAGS